MSLAFKIFMARKNSPSLIIFFFASQLDFIGDCDSFSLYIPPTVNKQTNICSHFSSSISLK